MEFHVQCEEPETVILTVTSSVFDGYTTKFMYVSSRMSAKSSFLDDNQEQQAKCECFSALITVNRIQYIPCSIFVNSSNIFIASFSWMGSTLAEGTLK